MKTLVSLLQLVPYLLQSILGVEGAVGAGNGETKKQIILDSLQAVAKVGEMVPVPLVAAVSGFVDLTVTNFNATGILKKPAATVTAPPPVAANVPPKL